MKGESDSSMREKTEYADIVRSEIDECLLRAELSGERKGAKPSCEREWRGWVEVC